MTVGELLTYWLGFDLLLMAWSLYVWWSRQQLVDDLRAENERLKHRLYFRSLHCVQCGRVISMHDDVCPGCGYDN